MKRRVSAILAYAALCCARPAAAHHSFAAEFDYDLSGTIEGTVVEVHYVNPHARYFIEVADDAGHTVLWDAQSRSPSALQRVGWSRDTIRPGEKVAIEGNLGHDSARKIWIRKVTLSSGAVIHPQEASPEEADND